MTRRDEAAWLAAGAPVFRTTASSADPRTLSVEQAWQAAEAAEAQIEHDAESGRKSVASLEAGRETMRRTKADGDAAARAILRMYDEITARAPGMDQGEKYETIRKTVGKTYGHAPSLSTIYRALRRARQLPTR